jgi:putative aldouronate transport system permease protein
MIVGATTGSDNSSSSDFSLQVGANIRAVTVVLTALPIMLIYPFIQRYFVSGVMLGAVKG